MARAKNCPLGLAEMTADFVNAYILGSVGATGANVGACATFLYNLRQGITDIRAGNCRVAVIGSSEAPITRSDGNGEAIKTVDIGDRAVATDDDIGANQRLSIGIVELSTNLLDIGIVWFGLEPGIGSGCGVVRCSRPIEAPR